MQPIDCLVVVDVQNGFMYRQAGTVVPKIEDLLKKRKFHYVVSTKFINEENGAFHRFLNYNHMTTPREQDLVSETIKNQSDLILEKTTYSCFNDQFIRFIKQHNIGKLYFVGVDIDACVLKSAFDCFEWGLDFSIIVDCCASSGGKSFYDMSLAIMERSLGKAQMCKSCELMGEVQQ